MIGRVLSDVSTLLSVSILKPQQSLKNDLLCPVLQLKALRPFEIEPPKDLSPQMSVFSFTIK